MNKLQSLLDSHYLASIDLYHSRVGIQSKTYQDETWKAFCDVEEALAAYINKGNVTLLVKELVCTVPTQFHGCKDPLYVYKEGFRDAQNKVVNIVTSGEIT